MEDGRPPYRYPFHRHTRHAKRRHSEVERGYSMERAYSRSESPLFVPPDAHPRDASPQYRARMTLPPRRPQAPPRYPGDGLDFRRPVSSMSNRNMNVIDLTDDDDTSAPSSHATPQPEPAATASRAQRLPRYNRQIIDLSTDSSPVGAPRLNYPPPDEPRPVPVEPRPETVAIHAARTSPDVEFVFERPLSRNQRPPTPPPDGPIRAAPHQPRRHPEVDLTQDLDDEVVHVRTEGRAGLNMLRPLGMHRDDGMGIGRLAARILAGARRGRHVGTRVQGFAIGGQQHVPAWLHDDGLFMAPVHRRQGGGLPFMDYETVAFELGLPDIPQGLPVEVERELVREGFQPPPPKYEPPPPPVQEPFTRSPVEDESLVCPNCGDELAIGTTEEKKQVWIVKACGHVYCGECIINRKKQRRGTKGKGRIDESPPPEPFSTCQAEACVSRVSHQRDVMQIFL